MSRLGEIFNSVFGRSNRIYRGYGVSVGGLKISNHRFAECTFLNAVELLTDLTADVTWTFGTTSNMPLVAAFKTFFNQYAKVVLTRYFENGYVVIAHSKSGEGALRADSFYIAKRNTDYVEIKKDDYITFLPSVEAAQRGVELYVMSSMTYQITGQSDKDLLKPYLVLLDNALNASNTLTERLGAMVVASPAGSQNTMGRLNEEEKKAIEEEIRKDYGALSTQSQFLLLPREMNMQVVSLANLDTETDMRVRTAVLAIADRLKVPANQIGMIDANSSKAFSNGSELREGDFNKYQSFERLLENTFVMMAKSIGLSAGKKEMIDGVETPVYYGIYNKPKRDGQV